MKVTVITVCYNAESTIKDTLESVLMQNYKNIEYIIQDGESSDSTIEIITRYKEKYRAKGIDFKIYIEQDCGIYDAMNKALDKVTGDWVLFMNADDTFCDSTTISSVFEKKDVRGYDVIYGGCYRNDGIKLYETPADDIETLPFKMPFMHQSVFVRSTLYRKKKYNLRYRLCADYDFFFDLYENGCSFLKCKETISNYSIRGVSANGDIDALKEVIEIKKKHRTRYPISAKDRLSWKMQWFMLRIKHMVPTQVLHIARLSKAKKMGVEIKNVWEK